MWRLGAAGCFEVASLVRSLASRDSLTQTRRELDEYFGRKRQQFDVVLDWRLTSGFRREVLRATAEIPYGHTASYRDVATRVASSEATFFTIVPVIDCWSTACSFNLA